MILQKHSAAMSVTRSNQLDAEKRDYDPEKPSASAIKRTMQHLTIIGMASDALWHHRLRQHYIGYPKTLNTCGIYAFWAAAWYCATKSGDWTHAAIAKEWDRIQTATVPEYDGVWDHGAVSTAAQTKSLPRRSREAHLAAACSLTIAPVFARLTYAFRPWFWQRRLPFKMIWLSGAAYTSMISLGGLGAVAYSRSRLREERDTAQSK